MTEQSNQESNAEGKMKSWIQENMRILVSIVIVIAIAGGVYSYSQRSVENEKNQKIAEISDDAILDESEEEIIQQEEVLTNEEVSPQTEESNENYQQEDRTSSIATATSQETQESFVETAGAGDGLTHLARRSLANYLEKNPDSSLTAEHKIYIEDYLRKNVGYNKGVRIGTSVEFSKNLIQDAISKAKGLDDRQLQNLKKYSARVSSLS